MERLRNLSRVAAAIAAALTLGLAAAGCDKEEPNPTVAEPLATPGDGGSLGWAISKPVITLDPLAARNYPDEMIAAQVYEPLASEIRGPESTGGGRMDGLATLESRKDGRVWLIEIRPGVKFHDNSPLDAEAVVENFERWLLLQPGRRLLPPVRDVKAMSTTEVRVRLRRPDTGFAETLSLPRLGLVSPRAFSVESAEDARIRFPEMAGSGPFRLLSASSDRVSIVANPTWWARDLDVGPALTGVTFNRIGDAAVRLESLQGGQNQVADGPFPQTVEDPLVVLRLLGNGQQLGVERSVRGLSTSQYPPQLARVWLTDLAN